MGLRAFQAAIWDVGRDPGDRHMQLGMAFPTHSRSQDQARSQPSFSYQLWYREHKCKHTLQLTSSSLLQMAADGPCDSHVRPSCPHSLPVVDQVWQPTIRNSHQQ